MIIDVYYGDGDHNIKRDNARGIRTYIEYMWERCQDIGLSPSYIPNPKRVSDGELSALQRQYSHLIDIIISYISKIELIIPMDNAVIDICTKEATVIYRMGSAPSLEKLGYNLGCIVSEEEFGNTALSLVIYHDNPTIVYGEEHFLDVLKGWASFCVPIHDTDGKMLSALNIMVPAEYANQNILGLIMVAARGIENEIMLIDEKTKLATTNELLTQFNDGVLRTASMISHEIRNSLSTISAYVQLLQLQNFLDNTKGDKILSEINRINKLVNNFRSLAEPLKFNFYKYSLNNLLSTVVTSLSAKAHMSNVIIDLTLPDQDMFVMIDRESMERVFINIIVNAIQAMEKKGGTLSIFYAPKNSWKEVYVTFEDTGPGITEDRLDDIFKIFYTTKEEGSGLGLAMCQYIVRAHGGNILVESIENKGTKFIVVLPCINLCTTE